MTASSGIAGTETLSPSLTRSDPGISGVQCFTLYPKETPPLVAILPQGGGVSLRLVAVPGFSVSTCSVHPRDGIGNGLGCSRSTQV